MIKNLDKINSIKRNKIERGLLFLEKNNKDKIIEKVIVFGSSVTDYCTEESDIDICLFTDKNTSNKVFFNIYGTLPLIMDDLCDVVIFNKIDKRLQQEILLKGVIVYKYK